MIRDDLQTPHTSADPTHHPRDLFKVVEASTRAALASLGGAGAATSIRTSTSDSHDEGDAVNPTDGSGDLYKVAEAGTRAAPASMGGAGAATSIRASTTNNHDEGDAVMLIPTAMGNTDGEAFALKSPAQISTVQIPQAVGVSGTGQASAMHGPLRPVDRRIRTGEIII